MLNQNYECPLYCVQQLLCVLQPVLPSCGMLRVHALNINRKNKGMISISFAAGLALNVRREMEDLNPL